MTKQEDYISVTDKLLKRQITVEEFEKIFSEKFANETSIIGFSLFQILGWLNDKLSEYTAENIDESELHLSAGKALKELQQI